MNNWQSKLDVDDPLTRSGRHRQTIANDELCKDQADYKLNLEVPESFPLNASTDND